MKTNYELRAAARESLSGNWTQPVLAALVYIIIVTAASFVPLAPIFLSSIMDIGFVLMCLSFFRGSKDDTIGGMFDPFRQYGRYLGVAILRYLYVILWALLFIIPGIIKLYSYSMAYYLMKDHPEMRAEEAINLSMKMMSGYKWKLFLLDLSFIGWILLSILTFGIGLLWLQPYIFMARTAFYEDLKANNQA